MVANGDLQKSKWIYGDKMKKEELYETINQALLFALANTHTIVVSKVTKVNSKTINCTPVTNRFVNGESKPLPEFEDVPPIFIQGGSSSLSMPISVGDYAILFVAERCFDAWYNGDDFVAPLEMRMHDYSDSFALVGINNLEGAITIPDVIELIGDMKADGNWEHNGNLNSVGDWVHEGSETITGDIAHTGNQETTGTITSTVSVSAPLLQGNLTGPAGGPSVSDTPLSAPELHAGNGFTGTKIADGISFVFVDGILIS